MGEDKKEKLSWRDDKKGERQKMREWEGEETDEMTAMGREVLALNFIKS